MRTGLGKENVMETSVRQLKPPKCLVRKYDPKYVKYGSIDAGSDGEGEQITVFNLASIAGCGIIHIDSPLAFLSCLVML